MKCPQCGNDMAEGYAGAGAVGRVVFPALYWYPDDEKGRKLYAIFEQK